MLAGSTVPVVLTKNYFASVFCSSWLFDIWELFLSYDRDIFEVLTVVL